MSNTNRNVKITYRNYRSEIKEYVIRPTGRNVFENNEWHPETQWLIEADDVARNVTRLFAMKDILVWEPM